MTPIRSLRTLAALAADNLRASRAQAAYLIITLAITTAAWLSLAAVGAPYQSSTTGQSFGITIRNGSQNSGELPLHYADRIEAIRGARDVFWYGIQPVKCTAATMVRSTPSVARARTSRCRAGKLSLLDAINQMNLRSSRRFRAGEPPRMQALRDA